METTYCCFKHDHSVVSLTVLVCAAGRGTVEQLNTERSVSLFSSVGVVSKAASDGDQRYSNGTAEKTDRQVDLVVDM